MNEERKKLMIESALSYYNSCLEEAAFNDEYMLTMVIQKMEFSCTSCPVFYQCFNEHNKMTCSDTMVAWLRGDI